MRKQREDFERLMQQRHDVARSYVNGDAGSLGKSVAHGDPATFFGPGGGWEQGAEQVWSTYREGSKQFASDSESMLEIIHRDVSDTLAY